MLATRAALVLGHMTCLMCPVSCSAPKFGCASHTSCATPAAVTDIARERFAENGDVRLSFGATSDDGSAAYGRLEIFNQGGWGSVCSSVSPGSARRTRTNNAPFPAAAADVACRQMGFDTGAQVVDGLPVREYYLD